jgi:phage terminase small subunit
MLTINQEKFVQEIIAGKNQTDAYRAAYPNQKASDKTVWECASKLAANPKVVTRIKELRDHLAMHTIMSAQERLEYLTRVVTGVEKEKTVQIVNGVPIEVEEPSAIKVKLNAIDIMNKMQGEYVTKIDGDLNVSKKLEDLI